MKYVLLFFCDGFLDNRSAKALRFLGDFSEAKNRIRRANRLKPGDSDILNEMNEVSFICLVHIENNNVSCRKLLMITFYLAVAGRSD